MALREYRIQVGGSRLKRILSLLGLGVVSPLVYLLGAEPFEVPGQNPIMERVGGSLALVIYCATCQFWFARGSAKPLNSKWARLSAMIMPIVATCIVVQFVEDGQSWRYSWVPFLVAGCVGSVLGIALGDRGGSVSAT